MTIGANILEDPPYTFKKGTILADPNPLRELAARSKIACAAICKKDAGCFWYEYQKGTCKLYGRPPMNEGFTKNVYKSKYSYTLHYLTCSHVISKWGWGWKMTITYFCCPGSFFPFFGPQNARSRFLETEVGHFTHYFSKIFTFSQTYLPFRTLVGVLKKIKSIQL